MNEKLRTTIAWWQIACAGLGLLVYAAAATNLLPGGRRWLAETVGPVSLVVGVVFFFVALGAGLGLRHGIRRAIGVSFVIQLLQVMSFAVLGGPHVEIATGPQMKLTLSSEQILAQVGFNSTCFIGTRLQGPAWEVTLNVLAICWAIALFRMLRPRPTPTFAPAP